MPLNSHENFSSEQTPKNSGLEANEQNSRQYWLHQLNQQFEIEKFGETCDQQDYLKGWENYGNDKLFVEELLGFFGQIEQRLGERYNLSTDFLRDFLARQDVVKIVLKEVDATRSQVESALWGVDVFENVEGNKDKINENTKEMLASHQTLVNVSREEINKALGSGEYSAVIDRLEPIFTQEIHNIFAMENPNAKVNKPEFQSALNKILTMVNELKNADEDNDQEIADIINSRSKRDWRVLVAFAKDISNNKFFEQVSISLIQNKDKDEEKKDQESILENKPECLNWLANNDNLYQVVKWIKDAGNFRSKTNIMHFEKDPHGLVAFRHYSDQLTSRVKQVVTKIDINKSGIFADDFKVAMDDIDNILNEFDDKLNTEKLGRSYAELQVLNQYANNVLKNINFRITMLKFICGKYSHAFISSDKAQIDHEISRLEYKTKYIKRYNLEEAA